MIRAILLSVALCLIASPATSQSGLREKLIKLQQQNRQGQKTILDEALRRELYDFVMANADIQAKDSRKFKFVEYAAELVMSDLNNKYDATAQNYKVKISDKRDQNVYRVATALMLKYFYRPFYACKGNDEKKVKESWAKVDTMRARVSELLQKDRSLNKSNTAVQLWEQMIEECRFVDVDDSLLAAYRWNGEQNRGDRYKYNNRMLRIIEDDQVNYDYLFGGDEGLDAVNTAFISNYLFLLKQVNNKNNELILTKDQIKFLAECILTKHKEVFNLRNRFYYDAANQVYDQHALRDAVGSLVNLSTWLRQYGLMDLNEKIITMYFKDEMVVDVVKHDPSFKEFWDDFSQRPATAIKSSSGS